MATACSKILLVELSDVAYLATPGLHNLLVLHIFQAVIQVDVGLSTFIPTTYHNPLQLQSTD